MGSGEVLQEQLRVAQQDRDELQDKLIGKKGKEKRQIRSRLRKLDREIRRLINLLNKTDKREFKSDKQSTRLDARNDRQTNRTERDIYAYSQGFNPIQDRWSGVAGVITSTGNSASNIIGSWGGMKSMMELASQGKNTYFKPQQYSERSVQGNNMMIYVVMAVIILMALKKK